MRHYLERKITILFTDINFKIMKMPKINEELFRHLGQIFVQVFCTNLNGNYFGTKYRLSRDKSAGLE